MIVEEPVIDISRARGSVNDESSDLAHLMHVAEDLELIETMLGRSKVRHDIEPIREAIFLRDVAIQVEYPRPM